MYTYAIIYLLYNPDLPNIARYIYICMYLCMYVHVYHDIDYHPGWEILGRAYLEVFVEFFCANMEQLTKRLDERHHSGV